MVVTDHVCRFRFFPPEISVVRNNVLRRMRRSAEAERVSERLRRQSRLDILHIYQKWIDAFGTPTQMMLGDLADLHEKVKSLILWRSPSATKRTISLLTLCGAWVTLADAHTVWKSVLLGIGIVAFALVPLQVYYPRYRRALNPIWWVLWGCPTDAQFAISILRQRHERELEAGLARKQLTNKRKKGSGSGGFKSKTSSSYWTKDPSYSGVAGAFGSGGTFGSSDPLDPTGKWEIIPATTLASSFMSPATAATTTTRGMQPSIQDEPLHSPNALTVPPTTTTGRAGPAEEQQAATCSESSAVPEHDVRAPSITTTDSVVAPSIPLPIRPPLSAKPHKLGSFFCHHRHVPGFLHVTNQGVYFVGLHTAVSRAPTKPFVSQDRSIPPTLTHPSASKNVVVPRRDSRASMASLTWGNDHEGGGVSVPGGTHEASPEPFPTNEATNYRNNVRSTSLDFPTQVTQAQHANHVADQAEAKAHLQARAQAETASFNANAVAAEHHRRRHRNVTPFGHIATLVKTKSNRLFLWQSTGLQLVRIDGKALSFSNMTQRDKAFNLILAACSRTLNP